MALNFRAAVAIALVMVAGVLSAQQTAATLPTFEVVSIHTVPRGTPPTLRDADFTPVLPGGRYIDARTRLISLIGFAYHIKNALELVGLPAWEENTSFSIAAKPAADFPLLPPEENREQVRLMVRAMLADRFHLQLHTETRQGRVLNLEVAKGGIKIKEVSPPVPPEKEHPVGAGYSDHGGRMIGDKSTMPGLASALTVMMKVPVIDRTGLKGYYDFDVKWVSESPDGADSSRQFGAAGAGLLISTLQEKFGLRLNATTGPIEYFVVDHVEPPTEN